MKRHAFFLLFIAALFGVTAFPDVGLGNEPKTIFTLADPRGDDHGDGSLRYPLRNDLHTGDLDIISFSARPESNGTLFEAAFAGRIAPADRTTIDQIGGTIQDIARFGFYTLNIDIYIDTDRIAGSGHTEMLPGRLAEINPANAWEKTICLTPRPFDSREALKRIWAGKAKQEMKLRDGRIDDEKMAVIESDIARDVAINVFFPTKISVMGSKIQFFVPASFLGSTAKATWSYVVAITGADIEQRFDFSKALSILDSANNRLMNLAISPGLSKDRFGGGREGDELQPPLVDIIAPAGMQQEKILKDYDPRTKHSAQLPGVVPAEQAPAPQTSPAIK